MTIRDKDANKLFYARVLVYYLQDVIEYIHEICSSSSLNCRNVPTILLMTAHFPGINARVELDRDKFFKWPLFAAEKFISSKLSSYFKSFNWLAGHRAGDV